jgi:hypothetical protein
MAAFTARWLQIADEYYAVLPADLQRQIDARVAELLEDPYGSKDAYDPATDQWITSYGGGTGLIVYAIAPAQRRVLILRLV